MRRVRVIGIGAGDPAYLTIEAIEAMRQVDVFFVLDKGPAGADLAAARQQLLDRHLPDDGHRVVVVKDPPRDRGASDYAGAVDDWREQRARVLAGAIRTELPEDGCGGILVWGDPALYDGTIRVLESIRNIGDLGDLAYDVVPGITAVQALAARHRIILNRVAGAVLVTTGRRLSAGWPTDADDVVVMLDADLACAKYRDEPIDIYWGAYLGTPDERLVSGRLGEVIDDLARTRTELRERKGWIMDTYLLRRHP